MNNHFEFITKCGLRVSYVYKPDFNTCYAGIGVKFGSADLEYNLNGKTIKIKEGLAHFLEHKLFSMPDYDAFNKFTELNSTANAYTTFDKTIYYFNTTADLKAPLEILLQMYFTPYFIKEEIETEKQIIISEIKMYEDIVEANFEKKVIEALYPNDYLSKNLAGTISSVSKITEKDIKEAYDIFYTKENSFLSIVGNIDQKELRDYIEQVLENLPSRNTKIVKNNIVNSLQPKDDFIYYADVEQTVASLGIRLPLDSSNPLICSYIIGILDCYLSPLAEFFNILHDQGAFFADIDYYVVSHSNACYAIITTNTNQPELFLDLVQEKLLNMKEEELDQNIISLYLKHLTANSLLRLDDVDDLGEEILSLGLENVNYFEKVSEASKMKYEDFFKYLQAIKKSHFVKAICKKKPNKA